MKMFDAGKSRMIGLPYDDKNYDDMLSRFHLIPERHWQTDRQTDGRTDGQNCYNQYRPSVCWRAIKTDVYVIDPQTTKVDQNSYIDLLKTSVLPECRRLYPGNDFEFLQDSVPSCTPRENDATVSATEQSRLHNCWWMGIIFSRS